MAFLINPSIVADDLEVKRTGASIIAREIWGALRGLETFSQLIYRDEQGKVSKSFCSVKYIMTNLLLYIRIVLFRCETLCCVQRLIRMIVRYSCSSQNSMPSNPNVNKFSEKTQKNKHVSLGYYVLDCKAYYNLAFCSMCVTLFSASLAEKNFISQEKLSIFIKH